MSASIPTSPFFGFESQGQTVEFDQNTAADHTVVSVASGLAFRVYHVYLENQSATDVEVTVKSGSTAVASFHVPNTSHAPANFREFRNGDLPVWFGDDSGEDLVLNLDGAFRIHGWITYAIGQYTRRA